MLGIEWDMESGRRYNGFNAMPIHVDIEYLPMQGSHHIRCTVWLSNERVADLCLQVCKCQVDTFIQYVYPIMPNMIA